MHGSREHRGNGIAIAAMVVGLFGLLMTVVTGWIPIVGFFLILLPTLLAIIFGFVGRSQARSGAAHGGKAAVGLTCGIVGLLLTVLMQLFWFAVIGGVVMTAAEMADRDEGVDDQQQRQINHELGEQLETDWTRLQQKYTLPELEIDETPAIQPATCIEAKSATTSEPSATGTNIKADRKPAEAPAIRFEESPTEAIVI